MEDDIGWSLSSLMEYYNPGVDNSYNNKNNKQKEIKDDLSEQEQEQQQQQQQNNSYRYNNSDNDEEEIIKSPTPHSKSYYQQFEYDVDDEPIYRTPTQLPKFGTKSTISESYSASIESPIPISLPRPILSPTKNSPSKSSKSSKSTKSTKSSKSSSEKPKDKETKTTTTTTTTTTTATSEPTRTTKKPNINLNQLKNYESPVITQIKKDFPYIELNKEFLYSDSKVLPSNFTDKYLDHLEDQIDSLWSKISPKDKGNEIELTSSIMKTLIYYSSKKLTDILDHMFYKGSLTRDSNGNDNSFKILPKDVIESSFVAGIDNDIINKSIIEINSILPQKELTIPIDYTFKINQKYYKHDKEIKRKLQIENQFSTISNIGPNIKTISESGVDTSSFSTNSGPIKLSKRKLDDLNVLNDLRSALDDDDDNTNKKKKNNTEEKEIGGLTLEEKLQILKDEFEKIKLEIKIQKYKEILPDWEIREYPDPNRKIIFITPYNDKRFYYPRHALNWNKENKYKPNVDNIDQYLDSFSNDLNKIISERRQEFNQKVKKEKKRLKQELYLEKQSLSLEKDLKKKKKTKKIK
ncbi:hypothetical protein DICPUDRAFT_148668 [Dictyostelium purpureum]|uniref:Uncharacterized protein n=1 Tax=Dictyostelium purpureum TaxID=5786 RepID=F0ZBP5_DICPU|nr:uncharacterized protein DICPUDRAFT_148668 [Dictyostelium purpureum]EGC38655.1 hypothetical protein DICPUDRAFT_148668 [Dictyostelium purpureum]|eukprot:XP_003284848.1 hypothetical protein DICPUDRAFT_148668 [Dictyostelium purpureum]